MKRVNPRKIRDRKRWKIERRREKAQRSVARSLEREAPRGWRRKVDLDERSLARHLAKLAQEMGQEFFGRVQVVQRFEASPGGLTLKPVASHATLTSYVSSNSDTTCPTSNSWGRIPKVRRGGAAW